MAKVSSKIPALMFFTAMFAACAQIGAPVPPSLELPKQVSDFRGVRKGNTVHFTWTPPTRITDGQTIRHLGPTRICRSLKSPMTQCGTVVAELPASPANPAKEYSGPFQADLLDPASSVIFAVEVLNSDGRSAGLSNQVTLPLVPTLTPPQSLSAQVVSQGVSIAWTWPVPAASEEFRLRIYRRDETGKSDIRVAEATSRDNGAASFVDQSIEWGHTYFYRATFVSQGPGGLQVEGEDSPEIKVFAHDVFPPATPSGLQAVFSSVGQPNFIDLTWAPNTDADLAGYNVYRQEEGGQLVKINSELARIPTYRDHDIHPGKKYFYSVTAVDLRGNESSHSEESSETVPAQ